MKIFHPKLKSDVLFKSLREGRMGLKQESHYDRRRPTDRGD